MLFAKQGPRSSGCRGCSCTLQFWATGACTRQFSAILLLIHTFSELLLTLSSFSKVFLWNCDFYDQNIFFPWPLVTIHQFFAPVNSNSLRGPCKIIIYHKTKFWTRLRWLIIENWKQAFSSLWKGLYITELMLSDFWLLTVAPLGF